MDSSVGLLLNFLLSFFTVDLGISTNPGLIIVDLLLFPRPPLLPLGFNLRCDMLVSGYSYLFESSEAASSFFLALTAFLWRSVETDLLEGMCFLSSSSVFVLFFDGGY